MKHEKYTDYVIRDGRLVGEFEEMYRDFADPWHQTTRERFVSEKRVPEGGRRTYFLGCWLPEIEARWRTE